MFHWFKIQRPGSADVETGDVGVGKSPRVEQCVLNGQPHAGWAELGFHGSVVELNHGMDRALRMHDHRYIFPGHSEQPVRLDHFKGFVHQGSGVDSDLVAHAPGGMPESLVRGDRFQFGQGCAPERSAAGRDHQAPDVVLLTLEALPDCAGFAVHGQDHAAMLSLGGFERLAGHDNWLFVGKRDLLSGLQGLQRRRQPNRAHQGDHDLVNFRQGCHLRHGHYGRA